MTTEQRLHSVRDTQKLLGGISRATFYRIVERDELKLVTLYFFSEIKQNPFNKKRTHSGKAEISG